MDRNISNYPPPPLISNRKILLHEDHKKGFKGELIEDGYARPRCPENRGSSIYTAATPRFLNFWQTIHDFRLYARWWADVTPLKTI